MAFRTWVKLMLATLGAATLAGASQLGMAYGLGIVRLTRVLDLTARDQWTAQLAWVSWLAMTAAVAGALVGARLLPRWSPTLPGVGATVSMALAAGMGAAVVVPLTMQPARTAQVAGVHPVFVIAACTGLGALVGLVAAGVALTQEVARWSLVTVSLAVWVLAVVSVVPSLAPAHALPAVRLGVFDAGFLAPSLTQRMALFTMPALALVAGALLGWAARRAGRPTLTIALAGLPGPALLTIAYLIAGPGSGDARYQLVPYWAAMTATGAGVLGSVLAALVRRGEPAEDGAAPAGDEREPLARRTVQAESAIALAGSGVGAGGVPAARDEAGPGGSGPPTGGGDPAGGGRGTSFTGAVTVNESAGPPPFDGFTPTTGRPPAGHRDDNNRPTGAARVDGWLTDARPARSRSGAGDAPYVPQPATQPVPVQAAAGRSGRAMPAEPGVPAAPGRSARGRLARPFGRSRTADLVTPADTATEPRGWDAPTAVPRDPNAGERPAKHHAGPPTEPAPRGRFGRRRRPTSPDPSTSEPAVREPGPRRDEHTAVRGSVEPRPLNAPPSTPEPVSPPIAAPTPISPSGAARATGKGRSGKQKKHDAEFVDWVNGLGGN